MGLEEEVSGGIDNCCMARTQKEIVLKWVLCVHWVSECVSAWLRSALV